MIDTQEIASRCIREVMGEEHAGEARANISSMIDAAFAEVREECLAAAKKILYGSDNGRAFFAVWEDEFTDAVIGARGARRG